MHLRQIRKGVCWVTYLFLFYALLVAYISGIGSLCSSFFKRAFSHAASRMGRQSVFCHAFWLDCLSRARAVSIYCNRGLMVGKICAFSCFSVVIGIYYSSFTAFRSSDPQYATFALPLLIISFGFHNMIPSLIDII